MDNNFESVLRDIHELDSIDSAFQAFLSQAYIPFNDPDNFNSLTDTQKKYGHILRILKNSLVLNFYTKMRRILSENTRDISLYHLYKGQNNTATTEAILPKSHRDWKSLKDYINKVYLHNDQKNNVNEPQNLEEKISNIRKDINETFNSLTVNMANESYSPYITGSQELSHRFFDKFPRMLGFSKERTQE